MPTGGGKSLCFQVPGMVMEGLCLVISPLIALMKDQVEQLQKRDIRATALYSGMSKKEIDIMLDNCIYGNYKFLYVSPERLKSELFIERLKKMPVNLLAIDEAHCISQWGYDFRPAYLDIAAVREFLPPGVATIALTATATTEVREDIIQHLQLEKPTIFVKSFSRANLSYVVRKTENKEDQVKKILSSVGGTSVAYVNARKATHLWAQKLTSWGFSAEFYHGGMTATERNVRQQAWMLNKSRVMVATNAFGMGIDKPDVRTVIHLNLPATLEAYYQEAGRAGRDEKRAYATLLFDEVDEEQLLERIEISYPSVEDIKKVYQCLSNYYKLAVGSGHFQSFPFDLKAFSGQYKLESIMIYHALKRMEEQGIVQLNEAFYQPSKVIFTVDKSELYQFQVANATLDVLIKAILRLYGGEAYNNFVKISEKHLAELLGTTVNEIYQQLKALHQQNIIIYEEQKDQPEIIFLTPRQDVGKLQIDVKMLKLRKSVEVKKAKALLAYLNNDKRCRTLQLLDYFGEVNEVKCGVCDVCISKRKASPDEVSLLNMIMKELSNEPLTIDELVKKTGNRDEGMVIELVRQQLDKGILYYDDRFRVCMKV